MFMQFSILLTLLAVSNAASDSSLQLTHDNDQILINSNISTDLTSAPALSPTHPPTKYLPFQLRPELYKMNIMELMPMLSQVELAVVGLHNERSIDFINAVMQCLAHIPQLYHFLSGDASNSTFVQDFNAMSIQLTSNEAKASPIVQFVKLLDTMYRAPFFEVLVVPSFQFSDMVQRHNHLLSQHFQPNVQQDAYDFLTQLLQVVSIPLSNNGSTWPDSNLFGIETYDFRTKGGDATQIINGSEVYSQSSILQLAIPDQLHQPSKKGGSSGAVSIYDCFQSAKFEVMEVSQPGETNSKLLVGRHRLITKTPEILIIRLQKPSAHEVEYPVVLDISQFTSDASQPNEYNLIGVVNHDGTDLKTGHYTAFAQSISSDNWHFYDDRRVEIVQNIEQVLNNPNAYLLFYKKNAVQVKRPHGIPTDARTGFESATADRTYMSTILFNSDHEIIFNHWAVILKGFDANIPRMEQALVVDRYITTFINPNLSELQQNANLDQVKSEIRSDVQRIFAKRLTTYGIAREFGKCAFVEFLEKKLGNETSCHY